MHLNLFRRCIESGQNNYCLLYLTSEPCSSHPTSDRSASSRDSRVQIVEEKLETDFHSLRQTVPLKCPQSRPGASARRKIQNQNGEHTL